MKFLEVGQYSGPQGELEMYDRIVERDAKPGLSRAQAEQFICDRADAGYCWSLRLDDGTVVDIVDIIYR